MSEDSLSAKDIEALIEATSRKEEKPLFDKIHADPFSVLNNDYWMREASIEILENLKMENFKNLSKRMTDKLSASEKNLFKEVLTAVLAEVIKSKNFLKLNSAKNWL